MLIGRPVPKVSKLISRERKKWTITLLRSYEFTRILITILSFYFVPETIFPALVYTIVELVLNRILAYFNPLYFKLICTTFMAARYFAILKIVGLKSGIHHHIFLHFTTVVVFFPDNPLVIEVESIFLSVFIIYSITCVPQYGPLKQEDYESGATLFRITVVFQTCWDVILYCILYQKYEIDWHRKLIEALKRTYFKQESFVGRLCHTSRTYLNVILPPLHEVLRKSKRRIKEFNALLFHASEIENTIQNMFDFHQGQRRKYYHLFKPKRRNFRLIESILSDDFTNQMDEQHRRIFGNHVESGRLVLKNNYRGLLSFVSPHNDDVSKVARNLIFHCLKNTPHTTTITLETYFEMAESEDEEEEEGEEYEGRDEYESCLRLSLRCEYLDDKEEYPIRKKFDEFSVGLSISKEVVEKRMGGTFHIRTGKSKSKIEIFEVIIPIHNVQVLQRKKPEVDYQERFDEEEERIRPKINVLIVEDNFINRNVIRNSCKTLLSEDSMIFTAVDGVEGLEMYEKHEDEIDVCLIDYNMPRMNGAELAKIIRRKLEKANKNVKLVLVTALMIGKDFKGREFFDLMLNKPVVLRNLQGVFADSERERTKKRESSKSRKGESGDMEEEDEGEEEEGEEDPLGWTGESTLSSQSSQSWEKYSKLILEAEEKIVGAIGAEDISEEDIITGRIASGKYLYYFERIIPPLLYALFVLPISQPISLWFFPIIFSIPTFLYLTSLIFETVTRLVWRTRDDENPKARKFNYVMLSLFSLSLQEYLLGSRFSFRIQMFVLAPLLVVINNFDSTYNIRLRSKKNDFFLTMGTRVICDSFFIFLTFLTFELVKFEGLLTSFFLGLDTISNLERFSEAFSRVQDIVLLISFLEIFGRRVVYRFKMETKEYRFIFSELRNATESQEFIISNISKELSSPISKLNDILEESESKIIRILDQNKNKNENSGDDIFRFMKKSVRDISLLRMNFSYLYNENNTSNASEMYSDNNLVDCSFDLKGVIRRIVEEEKSVLLGVDEFGRRKRLFLIFTTQIDGENINQEDLEEEEEDFFILKCFENQNSDTGQIIRVLMLNLIHNSIKCTQFGIIRVTLNKIREKSMFEITVEDCGQGVKAEKVENLNTSFKNEENLIQNYEIEQFMNSHTSYPSTSPKKSMSMEKILESVDNPSLGVGLIVCGRIVKYMNGTIFMESDKNGTKVVVRLPTIFL